MNREEEWRIPVLPFDLGAAIVELRGLARGGLEEQHQGEGQEVKGLKFISGKLARLFDRNRKLKYNHISRVLIDNFSSQSNDSRNIKRRVYDAINVMVAAGVFEKVGDSLQRREEEGYRERVDELKNTLNGEYAQKQMVIAARKKVLMALTKRKKNLEEQIERNKKGNHKEKIENPIFVSVGENVEKVRLVTDDVALCKVEMKRSGRKKQKNTKETTIFGEDEYLEYI